jgi:hypothetical protein
MTNPNPFASEDGRASVSFKDLPIGTSYTFTVDGAPEMVQARNFDTGNPDFWPDGNPKMTVVTKVTDKATGEEKSLWAPKPSAMFRAIANAAPGGIAPGGTLTVTFSSEKPNPEKPRLNPQKLYDVTYTAPNAFGDAPAPAPSAPTTPAPQAAPIAAKKADGPDPIDTAKQLLAAGLDDATIISTTGISTTVLAALRNVAA